MLLSVSLLSKQAAQRDEDRAQQRKTQRSHLLEMAEERLHHEKDGSFNIVSSQHASDAIAQAAKHSKRAGSVGDAADLDSASALAIPADSPMHSELVGDRVLYTEEMYQNMKYVDPDGGVWKQGWSYKYDGSFNSRKSTEPLTIHLMPHSHNDPGWIKTCGRAGETERDG